VANIAELLDRQSFNAFQYLHGIHALGVTNRLG
jgi:hypothetical protein